MTINGARGFNQKIADRFDLTLECIRLHYLGMSNPLQEVLTQNAAFFKLFENFAGYVDFFLLQDLISLNYDSINFFTPMKENFESSPLPESREQYLQYMHGSMSFTAMRNERIKQWTPAYLVWGDLRLGEIQGLFCLVHNLTNSTELVTVSHLVNNRTMNEHLKDHAVSNRWQS